MALLALANPINWDEDLFVAPAAVPTDARLYVDFLFLHMPLQAQLTRPFASWFPGYGFFALRIAMAAIGTAVLALVYVAQRGLGVERRSAIVCTALLGCCYSFQFCSGVVRNDILPALLATAGTQIGLLALRGRLWAGPAWGFAGALFGAAVSARLTYAIPAAAAGLFLLAEFAYRRVSAWALLAFAIGGVLGLAPCLPGWLAAPDAFIYSTFTYHATGPLLWNIIVAKTAALNPVISILITLGIMAVGPALGALVLVTRSAVRNGWPWSSENSQARWLNALIVGGIFAALLPVPPNFQGIMPMLPPLFIRLGLEGRRWFHAQDPMDRYAAGLMALGVVIGLGHGFYTVGREPMKSGVLPIVDITRQAHWIGERLRAVGAVGVVSTLSPRLALDSGYALDPRFAPGPFLYRSAILLSTDRLDRLHAIAPQNLVRSLDDNPPAAIIVGAVAELEDGLREYAVARRYRLETSPFGTYQLYIRPR